MCFGDRAAADAGSPDTVTIAGVTWGSTLRIAPVLVAAVLAISAIPAHAQPQPAPEPDAVAAARSDFDHRLAGLAQKHAEDVEKARAELIKRLTKIMDERTRAGNLDGALAARDAMSRAREEAEREAQAAAKPPAALPEELARPDAGVPVQLVRVIPLDRVKDLLASAKSPKAASVKASSHYDQHPADHAVDNNLETEWVLLGDRGHITVRYEKPVDARFLALVTRTYPGDDTTIEGSVTINGKHEVPIEDVRDVRVVFIDVANVAVSEVTLTSVAGRLNPGAAEILFLE